jgi:integrase
MARSVRDSRLETREQRLKLRAGVRHWRTVSKGLALGYRRTASGYGTWSARLLMDDGRYTLRAICTADDREKSDGETVLDFFQAQDKAREMAGEVRAIAGVITKPLTVADAAARYLRWYEEHRRAYRETEHTVRAHIFPAFGDRLVSELKTREIQDWLNKLAVTPARKRTGRFSDRQQFRKKATAMDEKRARRATANRILTVLKAILNKAFGDELVNDDKAWRKVKPFKGADEAVIRFLTAAQSTRLINACSADLRPLVSAALLTGARYSELANMKAADFNRDTATIYIRPSKSGKGRHVPLNNEGLTFFSELAIGKSGDSLLFTKTDGSPWGKNHHVRPLLHACRIAKIEPAVTFHELRHTYASLLAQGGVELLTISKLLGHADTRITARHYAHLCDRTLANAVKAHLPSFGHKPDSRVSALH